MSETWLNKVNWSADGLVPVIAQEAGTNKILTLAWMNREALAETVRSGQADFAIGSSTEGDPGRADGPSEGGVGHHQPKRLN